LADLLKYRQLSLEEALILQSYLLMLLTLAVAVVGGLIFRRLHMPAPYMVGAMVAVAIYSVTTGYAYFPQISKMFVQSIAGAYIGSGIQRENLGQIKEVIRPALLIMPCMLLINLLLGIVIHYGFGLDLTTALFASVPGGISDISLISIDMGANAAQVALLQLSRLLLVMLLFPPMLRWISLRFDHKEKEAAEPAPTAEKKAGKPVRGWKDLALTLVVGCAAGAAGYLSGLPAATMTFSMIAVILLNIFTGRAYMPLKIRRFTQFCSGALIGSTVTLADVLGIRQVLLPAVILIFGYVIMNLGIGVLIHKVTGLDLTTSLFATTPAGASDMALISEDLGADTTKVSVLHIIRIITVVAVFPSVISLVIHLLS
jgi:membrane AbrB-like protein